MSKIDRELGNDSTYLKCHNKAILPPECINKLSQRDRYKYFGGISSIILTVIGIGIYFSIFRDKYNTSLRSDIVILSCAAFIIGMAFWISWMATHGDNSIKANAQARLNTLNNTPSMDATYFDTVKYNQEGDPWVWGEFKDIKDFANINYDDDTYDNYVLKRFKTKLNNSSKVKMEDVIFSTKMLDEADCRYLVNKKYPKAIGYNFDDSGDKDNNCRAIEPVANENKLRWNTTGNPNDYKGTFGCVNGGYLLKHGCMAPGN